jgi:hypothetical protein
LGIDRGPAQANMQCRRLHVELLCEIACSSALYTGMLNCVRIQASDDSTAVNAAVLQTRAETRPDGATASSAAPSVGKGCRHLSDCGLRISADVLEGGESSDEVRKVWESWSVLNLSELLVQAQTSEGVLSRERYAASMGTRLALPLACRTAGLATRR